MHNESRPSDARESWKGLAIAYTVGLGLEWVVPSYLPDPSHYAYAAGRLIEMIAALLVVASLMSARLNRVLNACFGRFGKRWS